MKIQIKPYDHYQQGRFNESTLDFPEKCKVKHIAKLFNIPETSKGIIMINGITSNMNGVLQDNDAVTFFPMVSGG